MVEVASSGNQRWWATMDGLVGWVDVNHDLASIGLTAVGLMVTWSVGWTAWRQRNLRTEEVLAWASEAIDSLECLVLLCKLTPKQAPDAAERTTAVIFATASLVERGRLFFKNKHWGDYGAIKEPAYRGLRPLILDHLVLAHQIACALPTSTPALRQELEQLALRTLKRFVSMAQREVGRARARSVSNAAPGTNIDLALELQQHPQRRVIVASVE
jgi:hypothetical protein